MPHHFTKSTVSATFWCKTCGKDTVHYVFDGRRGGCKECIAKRDAEHDAREAVPAPAEQMGLFGGDGDGKQDH
jgi:hypothetical protein